MKKRVFTRLGIWVLTILAGGWAIPGYPAPVALTDVVRQTMAAWFGETPQPHASVQALAQKMPPLGKYPRPVGVFVTLSHQGKPRACWGSVYPQHENAAKATVYATVGALTQEYRYPPITRGEWRRLKPQVTVVTTIEPVRGIEAINPLKDGLMARAGGKSCVILPGEARDAHYQLVQCKLKAGIRPGEPYQLYRIQADVYQ